MQRAKTNRIPGLSLIGFHRAFVLEVHLFPFPFELKVSKSKKQIFLVFDLVIMRWFHVKIQQTLQKFSSLYKAETVYEGKNPDEKSVMTYVAQFLTLLFYQIEP